MDSPATALLRSAGIAAGHQTPAAKPVAQPKRKPKPKPKPKARRPKPKPKPKPKKHAAPSKPVAAPVPVSMPGTTPTVGLGAATSAAAAAAPPETPIVSPPPAPAPPAAPAPPPAPAPPANPGILPAWPATMPPATAGQGSAPGGVSLNPDPVAHLVRRATFGATPTTVAEVRAVGVKAWLDQQLTPESIDDSACDAVIAAKFPLLATDSLGARAAMPMYSWDAMYEVERASLVRAVISRRQLFEAVVDVWNQRFNVTCPSDNVWSTRHVHERVLRANALGKFSDLLVAVETSPAMLYYLSNDQSNGSSEAGVNENLGREMMELHTVGVTAGYTETDVRNSAYAISGLSVLDDGSDIFEYKPGYRYVGPLQVMGWSSPNSDPYGGLAVAMSYFEYLAHHPSTAANVCTALARRFVSDAPPASLVNAMVAAYTANDTAIVPVIRTMFASDEFWQSWGQKLRRPLEHVAATLRAVNISATTDTTHGAWDSWCWALGSVGMAPLGWAPPSGYPDVAGAWLSTNATLGRWNSSVAAVEDWFSSGGGYTYPGSDWATLLGGVRPATFGALVDALANRLIGQPLGATDRAAVLAYLKHKDADVPSDNDLKYTTNDISQLIFSSPPWSLR